MKPKPTHLTEEDEARWGELCAFAARAICDPARSGDWYMTAVVDTQGSGEPVPGVVLVHRYKGGRLKAHEVIALITRGDSFNRYRPYQPPRAPRKKRPRTRVGRR